MQPDAIVQLEAYGLREAERAATMHSAHRFTFEQLVDSWGRFIDQVRRFDEIREYSLHEYVEYLMRRRRLLIMQELLGCRGPKISDMILGPLDEAFFAETIRIEKPLSDWGPERHLTFFYRIPIRENRHFFGDLRARGII